MLDERAWRCRPESAGCRWPKCRAGSSNGGSDRFRLRLCRTTTRAKCSPATALDRNYRQACNVGATVYAQFIAATEVDSTRRYSRGLGMAAGRPGPKRSPNVGGGLMAVLVIGAPTAPRRPRHLRLSLPRRRQHGGGLRRRLGDDRQYAGWRASPVGRGRIHRAGERTNWDDHLAALRQWATERMGRTHQHGCRRPCESGSPDPC
jgi:hypothetical protein